MPSCARWRRVRRWRRNGSGRVRVLVLQHSAIDVPGVFGEVLAEAGAAWRAVDPWRGEPIPPLAGWDALLAMGGPQQTDQESRHPWLRAEKTFLREAVAKGVPVLGVCLGCQLLAEACGGQVGPLAEGEVGVLEFALTAEGRGDPLFAGLPDRPTAMQWHLNAVSALPPGAHLLARSSACAVQAFRIGRTAYGVQFHMEVDAALVRGVEDFPDYVATLEREQGAGAFERLVAETKRSEPALRSGGRRLFENFIAAALAEPGPASAG